MYSLKEQIILHSRICAKFHLQLNSSHVLLLMETRHCSVCRSSYSQTWDNGPAFSSQLLGMPGSLLYTEAYFTCKAAFSKSTSHS